MASRDLSPTGQRQAETDASRFTLDTSGAVFLTDWTIRGTIPMTWEKLTPFAQGYVEAMLSGGVDIARSAVPFGTLFGFRHLAPETLSRIIGDCERKTHDECDCGASMTREDGPAFWAEQGLTPYLGEDCLIYLREVGS